MALTRKQIEEMKKQFQADDKKNDATTAKLGDAANTAEALKADVKKAKTELGKEAD